MKSITVKLLFLFLPMVLIMSACDDEVVETPSTNDITIWSGANMTFEKADESDPEEAANQDRITDNVWITRGNDGGQIYNAVEESSSDKSSSPTGTQWAVGTTANIDNLTFTDFRTAVSSPKSAVGQDLVLLLVEDKIAIDIKFTSWSGQKKGGFAYERSTN